MKNIGKRVLCLLFVAVMLLSLVATPNWHAQATGDSLPAELQGVDAQYIKRYNVTNFALDGGGQILADADAYTGNAFMAAGMKLGNHVDVYRYAASGSGHSQQYINLLSVPAADVQMNDGYKFYKNTLTLPETMANGTYVYVEYEGWKCLNTTLAADLQALAGKTVTFYLSMKVVGDAASADVYIDQMILVEKKQEEAPNNSLPAGLAGVDAKHIKVYSAAANFRLDGGGEIVEDADAYTGKAFHKAGQTLGSTLEVYRWAREGGDQYINLLSVPIADVKMNAGYQVYSKTTSVPADIQSSGVYSYVDFGGWICQNYELCNDLAAFGGKSVTFYLSLKALGDAANAEAFIDQMVLVSHCEDYNVDGTCSVCGKEVGGEVPPTEPETPTEPEVPGAALPPALENMNAQHITAYGVSNFGLDGGGEIVADAGSPTGQAFHAAGLNAGSAVNVYRYASAGSDFEHQYFHLMELPVTKVKTNAGYQFYKNTVTVQEDMVDGHYVYVDFGGWKCMNSKLAADLKNLSGHKVDFYLSMKVVGDTANAELFIDQMFLVDRCDNYANEDGKCGKCGAAIVPDEPEPEDPPVEIEVDFVYTADDFILAKAPDSSDCFVEDGASKYGKAAKFSYAGRAAAGCGEGDLNALLRVGEQQLTLYTYGGNPAASWAVGGLSIERLKANAAGGQYVEYTFQDVDLIPTKDNYFFYLFDCWGFQVHMPKAHQEAIYNKGLVDVTISLKVEGDVSSNKNPPTYYIDMISVKAAQSGTSVHRHEYSAWTFEPAYHSATCATCGDVKTQLHKWDDGVVTKEATEEALGEKLYTCSECGGTKTEEYSLGLRLVFKADSFHLPKDADSIINDPTSETGMAARLSYADRLASGDADSAKALLRVPGQRVAFYNYGGGDVKENYKIGELASANLVQNAKGGKYVTYKFKNVKIVPNEGTYFMYMFDDWGFQIRLNEAQVQALMNQRVDVFLSMKVEGSPTSTKNPPVYFIDKVVIQPTSKEGDELIPYVPDEVPYGAKTSLPAEFKANDFRLALADSGSGDRVVSDPASQYGKAAMFSYAKRKNHELRREAMIFQPGQSLTLYTDSGVKIGEISHDKLMENSAGGEYVVYTFKDLNLAGGKYIYMFNCWGFQVPMDYLGKVLEEKHVDVSISLKVTGNVASTGDDSPAYYIDCVTLTEAEVVPPHDHEYGEWTTDSLMHNTECTICGIKIEGSHVWDEGVVTKEATETENGEMVYTCKVCGMKDVQRIKKTGSDTPAEPEKEPMNIGVILVLAGGVLALIVAVVVLLLTLKKPGKKN